MHPAPVLARRWEATAALILLAAVVACFLPVLAAFYQTWAHPGGGLENRAIALVAIIWLVTRQRQLLDAPLAGIASQVAGFVLLVVAVGLVQLPLLTAQGAAFVVALVGLVLFCWGRAGLAALWRPAVIAAIVFTLNGLADGFLPRYTGLVQGLQHLVAGLAAYLLWMFGFAVELQETTLRVAGTAGIDVYAACSGTHSLLEVGALALTAILTISERSWRANLGYLLACLAIALGFNVLRILLLAYASAALGQETFDALHHGWGASLYGNGISVVTVLFTSWFFQWNPFEPRSVSGSG